jgi:bifunctional DNase/RNase
MMKDREIPVHEYDLTCDEGARFFKLLDGQGNTLLNVPMDVFSVGTIFRCLLPADPPALPAHEMFVAVIKALGGKLQRVVIDELQKGVLFATLHFTRSDASKVLVKAEVCDALVIALRSSCHVYIRESILDKAKHDTGDRVAWRYPEIKKNLDDARAATREELCTYPREELSHLIEQAVKVEDYLLAEKLKKALQDKK